MIISISKDEQKLLQEALVRAPDKSYTFETTASFGQEAAWWTQNSPDCLVLSLPADDLMQGYFITKLRADVPRSLPILVLCEAVSASLMQLSQMFSKIRLLKTPADGTAMLKSIVDLVTAWDGKQQIHPRYLTDQLITVLTDDDKRYSARMRNLSISGAYFETENVDTNCKAGELIKIAISVGQPGREYEFDAKIVWVKPLEGQGPVKAQGYGVAFMNKEDVYNNLLKGF